MQAVCVSGKVKNLSDDFSLGATTPPACERTDQSIK
jgi:hypothetical protein